MHAHAKQAVRLLVAIGVSAAILWLLLRFARTQGGPNAPELSEVLSRIAPAGLAAYAGLHVLGTLLRALRFRLLLAAGSAVAPPRFVPIVLISAVRNMAVDLLPARLGELAYVALMNRGCRVPADRCLSSLSISFVFDMIALVVLVLALALRPLLTGGPPSLPLGALLLGLAIAVAFATAALFGGIRPAARILRAALGRVAERAAARAALELLDRLADAIAAAARAGVLLRVLLLSLCVRFAKYTSLFLLYRAITGPSLPDLHKAAFPQVMLALIGGEAGSALAIPTVMGFGTYEAGSLLALTWAGFPFALATLAMTALHMWSQVVDYAVGGAALVAFLYLAPAAARQAAAARRRRWMLVAVLALTVGGAVSGALFLGARSRLKAGAAAPPPPGHALAATDNDLDPARTLTRDLRGFVVWSSNRDGNHELYRLDLPSLSITRLTHNPHVDTFPRIAPDGSHIAFVRSQEPWVSQRNSRLWDVMVLNLETHAERRLAAGNAPTWSADGGAVIFQADENSVVSLNLATGAETQLFTASAAALPDGTELQTPSVDATGKRLVATLRGARRGTALIDMAAGRVQRIAGGCQITWGPGDRYLYLIDKGGRGINAIYRIDPASLESRVWLDLPGDRSHEYFPRVSADGAWLVLGATDHGHEHDTADYEIFLWNVGASPETAARLTFHTANDCWPDLYLHPALPRDE